MWSVIFGSTLSSAAPFPFCYEPYKERTSIINRLLSNRWKNANEPSEHCEEDITNTSGDYEDEWSHIESPDDF